MTDDEKKMFYDLFIGIDARLMHLGNKIDSNLQIGQICQRIRKYAKDMPDGSIEGSEDDYELHALTILKIIQTPNGLYIEVI